MASGPRDRPPLPGPRHLRTEEHRSAQERDPACDFRIVCLNCGALLVDRGCKSRCPRCHFFTDCSDPW